MALQKLLHQSEEVAEKMAQFITAFSLFGKCHNICDQNFIEEAHVHALDSVSNIFVIYSLLTFDTVGAVTLISQFTFNSISQKLLYPPSSGRLSTCTGQRISVCGEFKGKVRYGQQVYADSGGG